jgi:hypothetical protein
VSVTQLQIFPRHFCEFLRGGMLRDPPKVCRDNVGTRLCEEVNSLSAIVQKRNQQIGIPSLASSERSFMKCSARISL